MNNLTRREFIKNMGVAAVTAGLSMRGIGLAAEERPNILFILTDDQRWDSMSCMGHPFVKTPNMDRIAREGALFTNAFVTTSLCSPSRASFLTGAYAHSHGVLNNETNDPTLPTFPQLLQKAGYETAYVGKWHMERKSDPRPGFDYWLSFLAQGEYIDPTLNENGRTFQQKGYVTDILTDYAVRWLKRERTKPFCMILAHKAAHGPFIPADRHKDAFPDAEIPEPASFNDTYEDKPEWHRRVRLLGGKKEAFTRTLDRPVPPAVPKREWDGKSPGRLDYFRTLLAVDESIGRVLDTLEQRGELDNTVVIFCGDNGFFMGEHGLGDKRLMFEESIRIPFLMRYPKLIKAGSRPSQMALNIDLAPTLLDLAGVKAPDSMQGRSLVPVLKGKATGWRKSFLYEYFREEWYPGIPLMLGVRTDRWKYVTYPDLKDIDELYDLQSDPIEMRNLARDPSYADVLSDMHDELARLKKSTGYPEGKQLGAPLPAAATTAEQLNVPLLVFDFSTGKADDSSGNGNHGTLHGGTFVDEGGSKALKLDGKAWVSIKSSDKLNPSGGPITVTALVKPESPDGIIVAQGGENHGYSLHLAHGRPVFEVRVDGEAFGVTADKPIEGWTHLAGVIAKDGTLKLYVRGTLERTGPKSWFISSNPKEGMEIGTDLNTFAGSYTEARPFVGLVRSVSVWSGERTPEQIAADANK